MNSMYFSEEDIHNGLMQELLTYLTSYSYRTEGESKEKIDIHIRPEDMGAFVVEWVQVPWSEEWGGSFKFVDEDQVVATEFKFPDDHYELLDPLDIEGCLNEWLEENPGWKKDCYGNWYHED